ncbi:hypothetical protein KKB18_02925 [bacterium]|nr:hypothetical protein [bacterium]
MKKPIKQGLELLATSAVFAAAASAINISFCKIIFTGCSLLCLFIALFYYGIPCKRLIDSGGVCARCIGNLVGVFVSIIIALILIPDIDFSKYTFSEGCVFIFTGCLLNVFTLHHGYVRRSGQTDYAPGWKSRFLAGFCSGFSVFLIYLGVGSIMTFIK